VAVSEMNSGRMRWNGRVDDDVGNNRPISAMFIIIERM
jgi:hypothetical protein